MGRIGLPELLIILTIVILIFGANRLPELGRGIGKGIKNFKEAVKDGDDYVVLSIAKDFFKYGIGPRHLTMYKHFAEREGAFFESIVMPQLRQRNPDARRAASTSLAESTPNSEPSGSMTRYSGAGCVWRWRTSASPSAPRGTEASGAMVLETDPTLTHGRRSDRKSVV